MVEKTIVDATTWGVLTAVASLGAAANQDWASGHGRVVGIASVLAVIGAALKTFPVFTNPQVVAPVASEVKAA